MVMLGPNGITAKPIMRGHQRQDRREGEQELVGSGRDDVFFEEQFEAVRDRLQDTIGADFHRAHAILHPAENFPLGEGQDHDGQHHDPHHRGDLSQRHRQSQSNFHNDNTPRSVLRDLRETTRARA